MKHHLDECTYLQQEKPLHASEGNSSNSTMRPAWRLGMAALLSASLLSTLFPHPTEALDKTTANVGLQWDQTQHAAAQNLAAYPENQSAAIKTEQIHVQKGISDPSMKPEGYTKLKREQQKAVDAVLKLFPVLAKTRVVDVNKGSLSSYPDRNPTSWHIRWEYTTGTSSSSFNSVVDSKTYEVIESSIGHVTELLDSHSYYPPQVNEEQALSQAWAILAAAAPSIKKEDIRYDPSRISSPPHALFGPTSYEFAFRVKVNGLEADHNLITMRIDGNGQLLEYFRGGVSDFPSIDSVAISEKQAYTRLTSKMSFEAQYVPIVGKGREYDYKLAYIPVTGQWPLDAVSGQELSSPWNDTYAQKEMKSFSPPDKVKPFEASKQPLEDADAALAIINRHFKVPDHYRLTNRSLNADWNDPKREVWMFNWHNMNQTGAWMDSYTARVDAATGQILEFGLRQYGGMPTNESGEDVKTLTYAKAQEKAIEMVYSLLPDAEHSLRLIHPAEKDRKRSTDGNISIQFAQYHNEYPVNGGSAMVIIRPDGEVIQYTANIIAANKLDGLPVQASVAAEQAKQSWLQAMKLELQYIIEGGYRTEAGEVPVKTKLVYQFKAKDNPMQQYYVDATSGELFSAWPNSRENQINLHEPPTDVIGHAVEKELLALWKHGVIFTDSDHRAHPDAKLSYGEFLQMLTYSFRPEIADSTNLPGREITLPFSDVEEDSPYYHVVGWAYQFKWFDSAQGESRRLNLERTLTREEAAKLLVKVVHYDKLAQYMQQDKQVLDLTDHGQIKAKGEVAIALNLGLLEAENEAFHPKGSLTRADAARIIIALAKLQGHTDQYIG